MFQVLLPFLALVPAAVGVPLVEPELAARQAAATSAAGIATAISSARSVAIVTATGSAAAIQPSRSVATGEPSSRSLPLTARSTYVGTTHYFPTLATSSAATATSGIPYRPSATWSPANPCRIPEDVLEEYDYINAQVALRYGPSPSAQGNESDSEGWTRHNKLANTLQCLHPGPAVRDPDAPSIGLYGGLGVQLVPCEDAYYRWSIREDGQVVVGNGYNPLWTLTAEDTTEGANLTIREVGAATANQSFSLTDSGKLRLSSNDTGEDLCVSVEENDVSLKECSDDDRDAEQTFAILLLPRPRYAAISSGSASAGAATSGFTRTSDMDTAQPTNTIAARQVTATGQAATGVTATAIAATGSAAAGTMSRSRAATRAQSSVSRAAAATSSVSRASAAASTVRPSTSTLPPGCPAGYYW